MFDRVLNTPVMSKKRSNSTNERAEWQKLKLLKSSVIRQKGESQDTPFSLITEEVTFPVTLNIFNN